MPSKLSEHIQQMPSRRNPPYRPAMTIDKEEAAELDKKLGDAANYDIGQLRDAGLDDGEILEVNQVVSYFAYANRTVQGLGGSAEGELLGLSPAESEDLGNWEHA